MYILLECFNSIIVHLKHKINFLLAVYHYIMYIAVIKYSFSLKYPISDSKCFISVFPPFAMIISGNPFINNHLFCHNGKEN